MQVVRFLIVGGINTLIGLCAIYFAMYFVELDAITANTIGYTLGILLGFLLNKSWTFKSNDNPIASFTRYLLVLACAYFANIATVIFSISRLNLDAYIAQATGIFPYTLIGYLGSSWYAFRGKNEVVESVNGDTHEEPKIIRKIRLSIVVPCYNEEDVLPETTLKLGLLLQGMIDKGVLTTDSCIYYVDDGSNDRTWEVIESFAKNNGFVRGIKLSRNRGHQNALLAGLFTAEGEVVVSVDADLQDDLSVIEEMIKFYASGHDIVYGVRKSRKTDTLFKKLTATAYYRVLHLMGVDIIYNHADYRLLSRRAINALSEYSEVNLFLRGIIPQIGFPSTKVYYDRAERFAGESKYPLRKMLGFAWQGITSFSIAPLRMITVLGILISLGSFGVTIWAVYVKLFSESAIPGWTSTVVPMYLLGGVQLLSLGIIGEYLAKIYMETKRRPRFAIEKITMDSAKPNGKTPVYEVEMISNTDTDQP